MNSLETERYVLDANVFIQAHRKFYGLDFCPGFWQALLWHQQRGGLCSIDKVYDELKHGGDILWDWARDTFGTAAFAVTSDASVTTVYSQMMQWVMAQSFDMQAKTEFQSVADSWLVAYAKATGRVVVTLEVSNPLARKKIPLPNVCQAFDVPWITPFEMLRRLNVNLSWQPPASQP